MKPDFLIEIIKAKKENESYIRINFQELFYCNYATQDLKQENIVNQHLEHFSKLSTPKNFADVDFDPYLKDWSKNYITFLIKYL